ncbi:hypothetical protein HHL17_09885 [Chitinophaga sp. G-6-1-13]|uniref:Uncharacterized protein n=1 Tax=Chitinophaga fulva TaxID=2728842 RepID=A0A848GJC7_9BACT|nr:hypothetical protein [Chitinophaga fulva]NML37499.1 hypothetical protein [Chitinophaga fulva]
MYNLIIEDCVSQSTILHGFTAYFGNGISINWIEFDSVSDTDVLLEYILIKGDFNVSLNVYTEMEIELPKLAGFISMSLHTDIIISDEGLDPFSWILISSDGTHKTVSQIAADENEFRIKR